MSVRTLLLSTPFFGYHRHIIAELESRGHDVDYFNDRPSENPIVKGTIKVRPGAVQALVRRHMERIVQSTKSRNYDHILIINGKTFNAEFVEQLRALHPNSQITLYTWDAVELYPGILGLRDVVDVAFSFDSRDAERHEFELLPLFYTNPIREVGKIPTDTATYDLLSVCTAHPNRYATLRGLFPRLEDAGLNTYSYLYLHPLQYLRSRTAPEFRGSRSREFHYRPLPPEDYVHLLGQTRGSLDVNHSRQTGLTMRTIETFGAQRKLVTWNAAVREYDIYDPSRVLVMNPDEDAPVAEILEFMNIRTAPVDPELYQSYGVESWVGTLLNGGRQK